MAPIHLQAPQAPSPTSQNLQAVSCGRRNDPGVEFPGGRPTAYVVTSLLGLLDMRMLTKGALVKIETLKLVERACP